VDGLTAKMPKKNGEKKGFDCDVGRARREGEKKKRREKKKQRPLENHILQGGGKSDSKFTSKVAGRGSRKKEEIYRYRSPRTGGKEKRKEGALKSPEREKRSEKLHGERRPRRLRKPEKEKKKVRNSPLSLDKKRKNRMSEVGEEKNGGFGIPLIRERKGGGKNGGMEVLSLVEREMSPWHHSLF